MQEDRIDLDLDVANMVKKLGDNESLFYFRSDGKNISVCFQGTRLNIVKSLMDCMEREQTVAEVVAQASLNYFFDEE